VNGVDKRNRFTYDGFQERGCVKMACGTKGGCGTKATPKKEAPKKEKKGKK
jgi:hypothetical protein